MRYSTQIKPISFVMENATRLSAAIEESGDPVILTAGGEAQAVLMSVYEYERLQEALALNLILDRSERNIADGKTRPAREAIEEIRAELRDRYALPDAAE